MLIQNQERMFTLIDTMIIHTMDGIHTECLLLISLPGFLLAQTFTINGSIQDEQGQILPGAVVQLEYPWEEVIQSSLELDITATDIVP